MGMESLIAQSGNDLHDDARDVGMTMWQHKHDKGMQQRSYEFQKQLNEQMAHLSADARRHSAMDMVAGLKLAGLSPALASETNFGGVTAGGGVAAPSTSPAPVGRGQMGKLALETLRYQKSERALMDAQTSNLQAQAGKTNVEAQNMRDANNTISSLASLHFSQILQSDQSSDEEKDFASAMLVHPISMGSMQAYDEFMSAYPKNSQALKDKLENSVKSQVSALQLWDKEFAPKLAGLPKDQVDNLHSLTDNLIASTALLEVELNRTNADTELIKHQQNLVDAQIKQIGQAIKKMHHSDLIDLWENGEYMNMVVGVVPQVLPSAFNALGIAAGARTLRGRSPNPAFNMDNPSFYGDKAKYMQNLSK